MRIGGTSAGRADGRLQGRAVAGRDVVALVLVGRRGDQGRDVGLREHLHRDRQHGRIPVGGVVRGSAIDGPQASRDVPGLHLRGRDPVVPAVGPDDALVVHGVVFEAVAQLPPRRGTAAGRGRRSRRAWLSCRLDEEVRRARRAAGAAISCRRAHPWGASGVEGRDGVAPDRPSPSNCYRNAELRQGRADSMGRRVLAPSPRTPHPGWDESARRASGAGLEEEERQDLIEPSVGVEVAKSLHAGHVGHVGAASGRLEIEDDDAPLEVRDRAGASRGLVVELQGGGACPRVP